MENVTIGQIVSVVTTLSVIGGFVVAIVGCIMKWYKSKITDKFIEINKKIKDMDVKFKEIEDRLKNIEKKRDEYEKELNNSKEEREILMEGEWSALKLLWSMVDESKIDRDKISKSINTIEKYIMKKSHD